MKAGFWKKDWFLGLVVSLVLLFAGGTQIIQSLERTAYDWGVRASSQPPSDKVAVIAIDDASIRNIGRWPWSRDVHAKLTEGLAGAKAKVIGNLVFFSEPQIDPGLAYINKMIDVLGGPGAAGANSGPAVAPGATQGVLGQLVPLLREAEANLNTDRKLASSYSKAGNVVLPMLFELGEPRGKPDKPLPDFVLRDRIPKVDQGTGDVPLPAANVLSLPIEQIGRNAAALGHLNANPDVDGGVRTEPLVVQYYDQYYPSMSMMIAAKSLNLGAEDLRVTLGEGVQIGKLKIATDPALQMHTFFYKDRDTTPAFRVDSFFDVYSGKVPLDTFRDKIVLIGPTAAGVGTTQVTPISPAMAPVLTLANSVSSILQEHFFVTPTWGRWVEAGVFL
ncbi:MAG: CHASE2 domain-containing protein, partial [Burkholderiales bacterium]|nr:CHASE2 domain-containing protein [Burkholderiales bacterium]